ISSSGWTIVQLLQFFVPRILFSILCGGLVGLERELKNKPAGIKTNILICMGAALYTSISMLMSASFSDSGHWGDPARVAAQIVSGIGFIGAGTIIQSRGTILGLTTAATIWLVAAIGMCIGIGHADIAVISSVTVVLVLVGTNLFEDRVLGRALTFACEMAVEDPTGQVRLAINQALAQNDLVLDDFDVATKGNLSVLTLKYSGHRTDHKKFILNLWNVNGIKEVKQF
ncbi:MAG: MgtC/SapB family protein, partial [Bdellovibrionota bacterium]